jgi:predicted esterase
MSSVDESTVLAEELQTFGELAVLPPLGAHRCTVVFIHGLGFNIGPVWRKIFSDIRKDSLEGESSSSAESARIQLGPNSSSAAEFWKHTKFVFPTAPLRKIWKDNNEEMYGWYNIVGKGPRTDERLPGIAASSHYIHTLLDEEVKVMESLGGTSRNVILAGFSQGGAIATITGHTYGKLLGALIAMSGYAGSLHDYFVPSNRSDIQKDTPYVIVHGDADVVVKMSDAETTFELMKEHRAGRLAPDFHVIAGMGHDCTAEELNYVFARYGKAALLPVPVVAPHL